jgi:HAD superfamily hydrolase (TIGR01549 family)
VYTDVIPALKKLTETYKGTIKFGILSNSDSRAYDALKHHGLDSFFEFFVFSGEFDYDKPDPRIFMEVVAAQKIGNL